MKQQVEQLNEFHQNLQKQADAIWLLEAQKKLIPYFSYKQEKNILDTIEKKWSQELTNKNAQYTKSAKELNNQIHHIRKNNFYYTGEQVEICLEKLREISDFEVSIAVKRSSPQLYTQLNQHFNEQIPSKFASLKTQLEGMMKNTLDVDSPSNYYLVKQLNHWLDSKHALESSPTLKSQVNEKTNIFSPFLELDSLTESHLKNELQLYSGTRLNLYREILGEKLIDIQKLEEKIATLKHSANQIFNPSPTSRIIATRNWQTIGDLQLLGDQNVTALIKAHLFQLAEKSKQLSLSPKLEPRVDKALIFYGSDNQTKTTSDLSSIRKEYFIKQYEPLTTELKHKLSKKLALEQSQDLKYGSAKKSTPKKKVEELKKRSMAGISINKVNPPSKTKKKVLHLAPWR
ncbi:hypothetical protein ACFFIF_10205 [Vagococcus entomophilus]|uniref:Uncharacterized protein n=1 Tax=Vagococcus entomophilus TaxID=1160095 RepID=A0A430AG75_9ENTE|nr:hypothetical protein [Vagococcus entomophilus]RSU06883.1 hypothetical protein CBF30_06380 [Vagococcus entomophilus]